MGKSSTVFVGMDVHKESIELATADEREARRQTGLSKSTTDLAWRAQLRLCARFRRLAARGLNRNKIVMAIARELSGFVWAIGQSVKPT